MKSQLLSKGGGGDGSNIDIAELERQKQSHAEEKESLILEKSLAENELGEEEEREIYLRLVKLRVLSKFCQAGQSAMRSGVSFIPRHQGDRPYPRVVRAAFS